MIWSIQLTVLLKRFIHRTFVKSWRQKSVIFPEINFIVNIFFEKFWRQRKLCYLLCFKAFGKHLLNNYCGVLFSIWSKGWRKYSITSAEMNFFVQVFSLTRTEDRHNFFIYFVSKLLEKSFELTKVELFLKSCEQQYL